MTGSPQGTNGWSEPRPERGRFSSRRKAEAVLRLLHGEELDALSRELGVTAATLAQWRERFLAGGQASLKSRPMTVTTRSGACRRRSARSRWTTSCCSSARISWRQDSLWHLGGRGDEPGQLAPPADAATARPASASSGRSRVRRSTRGGREPAGPRSLRRSAVRKAQRRTPPSPSTAWARLRLAGVRTSKGRVLRLMRAAGPARPDPRRAPPWASEPRRHDHHRPPRRAVGNRRHRLPHHPRGQRHGLHRRRPLHAGVRRHPRGSPGTRFEPLEPLRHGLRAHRVAAGLSLRHDHGSQYLNDHFQGELRFLGIRSSPSFVAAPEGNGCAERFIRTLKEELLWVEPFETVQQLRLALLAFKDRYNQEWLVEPPPATAPRPPSARRSRRAPERLHDYRRAKCLRNQERYRRSLATA